MSHTFVFLAVLMSMLLSDNVSGETAEMVDQAAETLRKASVYFRRHVGREGGYLWRYSEELDKAEGEGKVGPRTVWVEPPGTPAVGLAWLDAYRVTQDRYYLEAAREVGDCLVRGQLESGGWDYRIELAPADRKRYHYRTDRTDEKVQRAKGFNRTTLDDNITQSSMRLLMQLDAALDFKDARIHKASLYALESLLEAQYPIGAWPQRYDRFPDLDSDTEKYPVKKASYPASWAKKCPPGSESRYFGYYTFNDGATNQMIEVMFEAAEVYDEPRYFASARRGGDFILLAQMPEPQPGWAQQYDFDMHPAWGRKWEAPSVGGGESQEVLQSLLKICQQTGDKKYLEPIPRAIAWLRRSRLPDGSFARFYEMRTNRAVYTNSQHEVCYLNDDLPEMRYQWHPAMARYGWPTDHVDTIERECRRLATLSPEELGEEARAHRPKPPADLIGRVRAAIATLDEQGRWIETDSLRYHGPDDPTRRVIKTPTFLKQVGFLITYIETTRE